MIAPLHKLIYQGFCACASLAVASYALLPLPAATVNALSYRGGQYCLTGGCHDHETTCSGNSSCSNVKATACLTGPRDSNNQKCGTDTGLCSNQGCGGADVTCGGN
jgi:hypothetical protein